MMTSQVDLHAEEDPVLLMKELEEQVSLHFEQYRPFVSELIAECRQAIVVTESPIHHSTYRSLLRQKQSRVSDLQHQLDALEANHLQMTKQWKTKQFMSVLTSERWSRATRHLVLRAWKKETQHHKTRVVGMRRHVERWKQNHLSVVLSNWRHVSVKSRKDRAQDQLMTLEESLREYQDSKVALETQVRDLRVEISQSKENVEANVARQVLIERELEQVYQTFMASSQELELFQTLECWNDLVSGWIQLGLEHLKTMILSTFQRTSLPFHDDDDTTIISGPTPEGDSISKEEEEEEEIHNTPNLQVLLLRDETIPTFLTLSPDVQVLRWLNYVLQHFGQPASMKENHHTIKFIQNFGSDFQSGESFLMLLNVLYPHVSAQFTHQHVLEDPETRGRVCFQILGAIEELGILDRPPPILRLDDLIHVPQPDLIFALCSFFFCTQRPKWTFGGGGTHLNGSSSSLASIVMSKKLLRSGVSKKNLSHSSSCTSSHGSSSNSSSSGFWKNATPEPVIREWKSEIEISEREREAWETWVSTRTAWTQLLHHHTSAAAAPCTNEEQEDVPQLFAPFHFQPIPVIELLKFKTTFLKTLEVVQSLCQAQAAQAQLWKATRNRVTNFAWEILSRRGEEGHSGLVQMPDRKLERETRVYTTLSASRMCAFFPHLNNNLLDLKAIEALLKQHVGALRLVFQHYAASTEEEEDDVCTMSMDEFYLFLKETKVLNAQLPLSAVQRIFIRVNESLEDTEEVHEEDTDTDADEEDVDGIHYHHTLVSLDDDDSDNPDFEFTATEFIEALCFVAERRIQLSTTHEDIGTNSLVLKFHMLLQHFILPHANDRLHDDPEEELSFRSQLLTKACKAMWITHKVLLQGFYRAYTLESGGSSLTTAGFRRMIEDAAWLSTADSSVQHMWFTVADMKSIFEHLQQKPLEQHQAKPQRRGAHHHHRSLEKQQLLMEKMELTYSEFCQAIAAIAVYYTPDPFLELHVKIDRLLSSISIQLVHRVLQ